MADQVFLLTTQLLADLQNLQATPSDPALALLTAHEKRADASHAAPKESHHPNLSISPSPGPGADSLVKQTATDGERLESDAGNKSLGENFEMVETLLKLVETREQIIQNVETGMNRAKERVDIIATKYTGSEEKEPIDDSWSAWQ
ncbi:unnamed protein product [Blumeria hordei]|uniref:Uncharacterized protein n=1 Tax=Blumeria hordei TaxID=2867405 RepID=A0A383US68_BLUHO|nr:unnamed protein product [Blumeria hordei]